MVVWTVQDAVGYGVLAVAALAVDLGARLAGADARPAGPGRRAARGRGAGWLPGSSPRARHRHWRYQVAEDALELRHGVVRRIHSAIPYFRVQHIDVAQGPVERAVGLARLIVHTASAGTDATIPGIAAGDADGLRRLILARAARRCRLRIPPAPGRRCARGWGGPRRLHILSLVFFAGRHARRLWPLALLLAARRSSGGCWPWGRWCCWPGAASSGCAGPTRWRAGPCGSRRRVLSCQLRAVLFGSIQQVDLVRKPLHRLLGVATLRVETAGGGRAAEVDLDVVTLAEAQALRASLWPPGWRPPTGALARSPPARRASTRPSWSRRPLRPSGCCCGCGSAR